MTDDLALITEIAQGVIAFNALAQDKQTAMIAWACNRNWSGRLISHSNQMPRIGKAECEWIKPWKAFYADEAVKLGFFTFEDKGIINDQLPGARQDVEWREYDIRMTPLGYAVTRLDNILYEVMADLRETRARLAIKPEESDD